jgi:hypothetical protein
MPKESRFGGSKEARFDPSSNPAAKGRTVMKSMKSVVLSALFLVSGIAAAQTAVYCTAKTNSLGCLPEIGFSGMPSASANSGFVITADNIHNDRRGLLFYGLNGPASVSFLGGTLCVQSRVYRTPQQNSLGTLGGEADCSGHYSIDMNAFAAGRVGGNPQPALTLPGTTVNCQYWNREESATFKSGLTDAVQYTIGA